MKKKANRILSFILLWSMLLGCVPQSVFAAEPEETMEVTEAVSENTVDSVSGDEAAAEETVSGNAAESVSTDEASEEEKEEAASGNAAEEVSGNGVSEEESVSGNETPSENEALSENEAAEENVSENNAEELPEESPEPEEPLEPEIVGDTYVYHVSEVYYLDDAFNSTGAGRTTRIVLTRDLDFGFEGMMKGDPGAIITFNVRGNVILDFNGHKITGKMSGQYHDTISTWSFLHFYLCMGDLYYYENDSEKAASLTFEDSVGGGGIFIKAVTEKDTPLQAVDISVRNYYTYIFRDGVIGQQSGAEAIDGMKVTVNGGIFQLESEVLSGGDSSRDDYTAADDEETVTGIRETDFTRSAFSIKNVCDVEINGGTFIAIGGDETARRELSAFGIIDRYLGPLGNRPESGLRINGGKFIGENCYALKGYRLNTSSSKAIESVSDCPRIRGGYFNGGICFTGKDYRDVDDYKKGVVNFSINRANSATMLFDEDSNLYIAGVSAQASDYTWQDLEMKSVIELFPASCAEIESVAINGDVMSADDVYWTESGTELFITSEAAAMPDWVKSGYSEAYDKSGFYVYNINNLGTPVHQEVQAGNIGSFSYTAEPGEYRLVLTHQIQKGSKLVRSEQFRLNLKVDVELEKIEVTTPPDKTVYLEGEAFDPTGMVITASYSSGTKETVKDYEWTRGVGLTKENKDILFSYTFGGITQTTVYTPTVYGVEDATLQVVSEPERKVYRAGEYFAPGGMKVLIRYPDGQEKETDSFGFSPSEKLTTEDKEITISYTYGDATITAEEKVEIRVLDLSVVDVTAVWPTAGKTPSKPVSKTTGAKVNLYEWYSIEEGSICIMQDGEVFEEGKDYRLSVVVGPAYDGLTFDDDTTVRFNEKEGNPFIINPDALNFYYVFRYEYLRDLSVRIKEPVAGEKPDFSLTALGKGYAGFVVWQTEDGTTLMGDDVFEKGQKYKANVFISPQENYHFDLDALKVSINGKEAAIADANSGMVSCVESYALAKKTSSLKSLSIAAEPVRTTYTVGDRFDAAGMVVMAMYSDGSRQEVTNYTISPSGGLALSDEKVTISFTDRGITQMVTQDITVFEKDNSLYVKLVNGDTYTYTGTKIMPVVQVMYQGKELKEGVDYTVKYKNNINASVGAKKLPTVTVKGITVAASGSRAFTIEPKDIRELEALEQLYVNKGKMASPAIYYAGKKLGAKDLDIPDAKKKFETDGLLKVTGKGNFCGSRVFEVILKDTLEKQIKVSAFKPAERVYNGSEQKLTAEELRVMSGDKVLTYGTDYTISYPLNCADAGTHKVCIAGIGQYSGSVSKSYKIKPLKAEISVTVCDEAEYKAGGATPDVNVGGLVLGRDYTLKYKNNKKVSATGNASVTVKFIGNYKGSPSVTKVFKLIPRGVGTTDTEFMTEHMAYTKPGKYFGAPLVKVDGVLLKTSDMDVSYKVNGLPFGAKDKITDEMMKSGSLTVEYVISGKGNYCGSIRGSYEIVRAENRQDLSKAKISFGQKSYRFTGKEVMPQVTVQMGSGKNAVVLTEGVDYRVEYADNINKGKGSVAIIGLGNSGKGSTYYFGSKKASFSIGTGIFNWL